MFNNDEDDDTPVAVDPELDTEIADAEGADEDDEADVAAARKPKRAGAKAKKAAGKAAAKAKARKPARSVTKAAPAKAASKPAKKPAKAAKATAPPADLTGVKAGAHTLWVSKDLAGALTSKDRRRLKALLKRAEKRRKAQKK